MVDGLWQEWRIVKYLGKRLSRLPKNGIHKMFCDAGFRPGSRGPFVSAKGPKTIDAQSGLIRVERTQVEEGGPTRCAQTRPANLFERPLMWPDGRRQAMRIAMKNDDVQ